MIEIEIKLLSNWGHKSRIGLTEVQLFRNDGQQVDIDPACVHIQDGKDATDVSCLFNGKYKVCGTHNFKIHIFQWKNYFLPAGLQVVR